LSGDCVEFTTCSPNTNYDSKLSVYEGTCAAPICVDGNDDDGSCTSGGTQSTVNFISTAGTQYLILVHGFGANAGEFDLSLTCTPLPANDMACGAVMIAPADGSCATAQAGEPNPGSGTGGATCDSQDGWCSFELVVDNSLWYSFVAPASGNVTIETVGTGDTQLALWEATDCADFATFTEVAANDDGGVGLLSALTNVCVIPGQTYWIQVDGYTGSPYIVDVTLTENAAAPVLTTCPADIVASCTDAPPAAAATSAEFIAQGGTIDDPCGAAVVAVSSTETVAVDGCGTIINRTYTIDNGFTSATCMQTISLLGSSSRYYCCGFHRFRRYDCRQLFCFISNHSLRSTNDQRWRQLSW